MFLEESENNIYEPLLPPWVEPDFEIFEELELEEDEEAGFYLLLNETRLRKKHLDKIIDIAFEKIAGQFSSYQQRQDQIRMSKMILNDFYNDKSVLVEAGTGIGKSFAYLVATMAFSYLTGTRVCISTETKNLQMQLFEKDILFLQKTLAPRLSYSLCLGSGNYLCPLRYQETFDNGSYRDLLDDEQEQEIRQWAKEASSGKHDGTIYDLEKPPRTSFLSLVNRDSDGCPGNRCSLFSECNYYRARKRWSESRLLVVNHHLLLLHFLNDKKILPAYGGVVIDEAHGIIETGYSIFSLKFSQPSLPDIKKSYDKVIRNLSSDSSLGAEFIQESEARWNLLITKWLDFFSQWEVNLDLFGSSDGTKIVEQQVVIPVTNMAILTEKIQDNIASLLENTEDSVSQNYLRAIDKFLSRMIRFVENFSDLDKEQKVFWGQKKKGIFYLNTCNLNLGEEFSEFFVEPQLWTSATLGFWNNWYRARSNEEKTAKGYFKKFIEETLPLSEKEISVAIFDSPFSFQKQSMLYIPAHLSVPAYGSNPLIVESYEQKLAEEIAWLAEFSQGGCLALFTSNYRLRKVHEFLEEITDLDIISQLDSDANTALELFKKNNDSILLGSASFWQGVDVVGEQLRLVIITQIMFPPPSDPIFKARSDLLEKKNRKSFFELSVPAAGTMLRQAFGRLIRSENDKGLVAVLDSRVLEKSYGKVFLTNLPAVDISHEKRILEKELRQKNIFS